MKLHLECNFWYKMNENEHEIVLLIIRVKKRDEEWFKWEQMTWQCMKEWLNEWESEWEIAWMTYTHLKTKWERKKNHVRLYNSFVRRNCIHKHWFRHCTARKMIEAKRKKLYMLRLQKKINPSKNCNENLL